MRTLLIAGAGIALLAGGAADAQRIVSPGPGAQYPMPGRGPMVQPPMARPPMARPPMSGAPGVHPMPGPAPIFHPGPGRPGIGVRPTPGSRWGSRVGGRWWGGANAPGGWNAYRRPVRGYVLPSYWVAPRFFINDWQSYGLRQPSYGYNWVRYYDDAVLVDGRGSVYDSVGGLDWDGAGYAEGYGDDGYDDGAVYARPDDRGYRYERRDNGLGGAAIGAVAGGVAGNVIAGRGNRLGGTLIGAGVGAAAGYAIDKAEDRGRRAPPPPPAYRGEYPPVAPAYGAGYPPPPVGAGYAGGGYGAPGWTSPDGRTTVVTSGGGWGGSTTTVVVQSAPIITTTTTEVIEDHVTYTRKPARTWVKRSWKPRPRCACR